MNSISITGRLGKDAELKTVGDNQVASFSLVHDQMVKGEKTPMWFDCSVWGKRAATAAQYLKKGGTITVIGRLMPAFVSGEKAYLKVDVTDFTLPAKGSAEATAEPAAKAAAADEIPF